MTWEKKAWGGAVSEVSYRSSRGLTLGDMTSVPSLLALLAITYAAPGPPIQDNGLQFYNIQGREELPIDDDVPLEDEEGEQSEVCQLHHKAQTFPEL
uniref:Cadherin_C domain-containing protein n=1 Tax=Angiostrongylus cantonensis TaxID=6313 RepID=A0A0K0D6P8_ANGCA